MKIIDYDPSERIPPIHENDINTKIILSVIRTFGDETEYISYFTETLPNSIILRGNNFSRGCTEDCSTTWVDTEGRSVIESMLKEYDIYTNRVTYYVIENMQEFQDITRYLKLSRRPVLLSELQIIANCIFGSD